MTYLRWHTYSYYPYERDLARREIRAILGSNSFEESQQGIKLSDEVDWKAAENLTYIAKVEDQAGATETLQARLEVAARNGRTRQATRYSVHGIHEYKGKFNPQVAKALLNIFGVGPHSRVLDPFCGSGTTLVECSHIGATGVGVDLNPLAVYLTNAKLASLVTPAEVIRADFEQISRRLLQMKKPRLASPKTNRDHYLRSWFSPDQLIWIEAVRKTVQELCPGRSNIFLVVASNLLRDYSDQEPSDLRIRRRSSPLPSVDFREAFLAGCEKIIERLVATQTVLGVNENYSHGLIGDVRTSVKTEAEGLFDAAITSPPYATALPYIDTQRLSLIWLGLCEPNEIAGLDAALIGSREATTRQRKQLSSDLADDVAKLPTQQLAFCKKLEQAVGQSDGFRRLAVPGLLYKYFWNMRDGFEAVSTKLKTDAPYALIVGHNHSVLGGVKHDIDTPAHLASLAQSVGWIVEESVPLQTYMRYGLHAGNAVANETLLILRNTAHNPLSM